MTSAEAGETRWDRARARERAAGLGGYAAHFRQLIADGADIEGEARLADALVPRGARILDAGCGIGRVGAALQRRGHHVVGVDYDGEVLADARSLYPDLPLVTSRLDRLSADDLAASGHLTAYDLVVCVGNVMVLLAEGTERLVLANLAALLAPGGRMLVGHHLDGGPGRGRPYPVDDLEEDAAAAGLAVDARFGTYDLRPFTDDSEFAVHVLRHA